MKATLKAWSAQSNRFHQGVAKESTPEVVAAIMSKPGVVLRRPVGSNGRVGAGGEQEVPQGGRSLPIDATGRSLSRLTLPTMGWSGTAETLWREGLALPCANSLRSQASAWRTIRERSSHWGRQPSRLRIRSADATISGGSQAGGRQVRRQSRFRIRAAWPRSPARPKSRGRIRNSASGALHHRAGMKARDNERLRGRSRGVANAGTIGRGIIGAENLHLLSQTHGGFRCNLDKMRCSSRCLSSAQSRIGACYVEIPQNDVA